MEEDEKLTAESSIRSKVSVLAAASAASLPGKPVWPGTQQNTTDFPGFWR
jgi:hypothetical protein